MADHIETKKSLGQHWLDDELTLQAIANAADVKAGDTVLEIGPGPGTLTSVLTERAEQVIAVELDDKLASDLKLRVPTDNLYVINQDIMQFDFSELKPGYKVVANIPYYLTSNLIRLISEINNKPSCVVLLIQKEVAERAAAAPGAMSMLSVSAQFFWQVSLGQIVPAELFTPPPKVDSQVLILNSRSKSLFSDVDEKLFFRLVKAGFSQRRKTLLNSLSAGLQMSKDEIKVIAQKADIDIARRAQSLSLDEWHRLYLAF